jgi:hypothetical protein
MRMTTCNYIDLEGKLNSYIYRVIPLHRLYELFTNRENVLLRPSKWDDPFENFVLNAHAKLLDGEIVRFGFNNDFYGQCWTMKKASDAMWRIYSPSSDAVRIRTTVRKLGESLGSTLGEWAHVQAFVGRVSYLSEKALLKFGNEIFADGLMAGEPLARTLLVKRLAFDHEKEVRLLYFRKEEESSSDLFPYPVDPHALIDQIMIDPRMDKGKVEDLKAQIRQQTGFQGSIKRSLLYAPPDGFIFPIGAG